MNHWTDKRIDCKTVGFLPQNWFSAAYEPHARQACEPPMPKGSVRREKKAGHSNEYNVWKTASL